jgi:cell division protein FtsQ
MQERFEGEYGDGGVNRRVPERKVNRAYDGVERRASTDRRMVRRGAFGAGMRLRIGRRVLPRTLAGRIAGGWVVVVGLGVVAGAGYEGQRFLLHDERFVIPSSAEIQIEGNSHLTRAQLLSIFGEDVERNVFGVPLGARRSELERLPWVEHATVMRLLPNRLRVSIVERKPVAFVRQGTAIGLVDKNGVLLDMDEDGGDGAAAPVKYSFPVVTGISEDLPLSVRAPRMRLFGQFTKDLDSSGEGISGKLSEVDLSNPEDVKALIPEGGAGAGNGANASTEILVHFGDSDFLARYKKFEEQLPNWLSQYPRLASADMRYERQVVLEMQAGAAVPLGSSLSASNDGDAAPVVKGKKAPAKDAKAVRRAR